MNRNMIRHGFILLLVALIAGLFIPEMKIPRLGLSAHTIGILGSLFLIAVGTIWPKLSLSHFQREVLYWSWLYSGYVNWAGCLVGAIFGAGQTTPVASGGVVGPTFVEMIVAVMLISVAVVSFVAVALCLWGLRSGGEEKA